MPYTLPNTKSKTMQMIYAICESKGYDVRIESPYFFKIHPAHSTIPNHHLIAIFDGFKEGTFLVKIPDLACEHIKSITIDLADPTAIDQLTAEVAYGQQLLNRYEELAVQIDRTYHRTLREILCKGWQVSKCDRHLLEYVKKKHHRRLDKEAFERGET